MNTVGGPHDGEDLPPMPQPGYDIYDVTGVADEPRYVHVHETLSRAEAEVLISQRYYFGQPIALKAHPGPAKD